MKKNYSLLLILFVFITNIFSAQTYYYYKGQKQIFDTRSTESNINISSYSTGYYTIALIVNGEIVDTKTLIKQ